jgi:hypothetical protein
MTNHDTLMLDPFTSLIVTFHSGTKHHRAEKLDPEMYEASIIILVPDFKETSHNPPSKLISTVLLTLEGWSRLPWWHCDWPVVASTVPKEPATNNSTPLTTTTLSVIRVLMQTGGDISWSFCWSRRSSTIGASAYHRHACSSC